jgi:vancomycin permeability regulator SanA
MPGNPNIQNIIKQFQQFKKNFSGDPQQQIQQLLNSGKVSQQQYDQAVQMAKTLQNMMK